MKTLKLTSSLIAGVALLSAGSAMAFSGNDIPGVSATDINIVINGNTATVTGHVDSNLERYLVAQYVSQHESVDRVFNLVTTN